MLFSTFRFEISAGLLIDTLHRQLDLAAIIEPDDLDLDHIAFLANVGSLFSPAVLQFRNVNKSVLRPEEVYEGAKIDGLHNLAVLDYAQLGLGHDVANACYSGLT